MEHVHYLLNYILHLDRYLISFVAAHGIWTYLVAFAVIFCETGLVVTPFLPGDSLIFALGSIAAHPQNPLSILILLPLLILASILGNQVNYSIGRAIGPKVFSAKRTWFFNKKHLEEAHQFYEKHGGKTIVLARFIPIIRTFAPFIAGVSYMNFNRFNLYNIGSAILWIGSLLGMGFFLGSLPFVKENFSVVIYGIIAVSMLPPLVAFVHQRIRSY
ncbi:MAG: DedA family protein [Legionellaceae bacterium]|nr:DedA family protein [Legionellaceae bacterium]